MKIYRKITEISGQQRQLARRQYIAVRAQEGEVTEDEAELIYGSPDKEPDRIDAQITAVEIDTEDDNYIFVNI